MKKEKDIPRPLQKGTSRFLSIMLQKPEKVQALFFSLALTAVAAYLFSQYGRFILSVLMPFLFARIFADFLYTPIRYLHNELHLGKGVACFFTVITFYAAMGTVGYLAISRLIRELSGFSEVILSLGNLLPGFLQSAEKMFHNRLPLLPFLTENSREILEALLQKATEKMTGYAAELVPRLASFVPRLLIAFAVTVLATCYFSADLKTINRFILFQLPQRVKVMVSECRAQFFTTVSGYCRAYGTIALITFCELFVGLLFIRREYALLLALITTLVDILPILGSGTVLLPWAFAELAFGHVAQGVALILLYIVISAVRQLIEPRILGMYMGLSPLITLFAMYAGGKLLGLVGLFLAPMLVILLKHLNEKGILHLYRIPPEDTEKQLSGTRKKYRKFRRGK